MNAFLLTVGLSFVLVNGVTLTIGPDYRGVPQYWDVPPLQFLGMRVTVRPAGGRRHRVGRDLRGVALPETHQHGTGGPCRLTG